jgi:hypothetical protein
VNIAVFATENNSALLHYWKSHHYWNTEVETIWKKGPMLWFQKHFCPKKLAKMAFLTQNKAKILKKNWSLHCFFLEKRLVFAENWQKSQKIVIITSTPSENSSTYLSLSRRQTHYNYHTYFKHSFLRTLPCPHRQAFCTLTSSKLCFLTCPWQILCTF